MWRLKGWNRYISRLAAVWLTLFSTSLLGVGCGSSTDDSVQPVRTDPMEMQRTYEAPKSNYMIAPGVRLVGDEASDDPLVLASNVYQLPDTDAVAAQVDEERMIIPRSEQDYLLNREVGDIVISRQNGIYWRRITDIQTTDDAVIWRTDSAQMTEVFKHAHFFMQVDTKQVHPDRLPDLDLAMPYMQPDSPPKLRNPGRTRAAPLEEKDCPQAPACQQSERDPLCVTNTNPDIICQGSIVRNDELDCEDRRLVDELDLGLNDGCTLKPTCYVTGTDEICPDEDQEACDDPDEDACERRTIYAGNYTEANLEFNKHTSMSYPFDIDEFQCEHVVDHPRLVVKTCEEPSECYTGSGEDEDGNALPNNFPEANGVSGYVCKKITSPHDQDRTCTSFGDECSNDGDCCSRKCEEREVVRNEGTEDEETAIVRQCARSTEGYCMPGCAGGTDEHDVPEEDQDIGSDLANLLGVPFIEDIDASAQFEPSMTFEIDIDWFTLELLKLTVGADFYFDLGFTFAFSEGFSKSKEKAKSFELFGFAILGYPFTVNLDLHAMATLSATMGAEWEPKFGFFTYASDDKYWEDSDFPDKQLPAVEDDADETGIEMGFVYKNSGDGCAGYAEKDCKNLTGKWYGINRFKTESFFDDGLQLNLDVRAAAEIGAGIGLYDQGLLAGSRLIGLEPINLLARLYGRVNNGFCGVGFNLYYRMFLNFGPLKLFGQTLLSAISLPILNIHLNELSFDYRLPDDLEAPKGDGGLGRDCSGADEEWWGCRASNALDCGTSAPEADPTAGGSICTKHGDCDNDGERCIGKGMCVEVQPEGSLRVSLEWFNRRNLNLQVRTPDGDTITKSTHDDMFAGACGDPDASGCDQQTTFGETVTFPTPDPGIYTISVTSNGNPNTTDSLGFGLEIEEEGVNRQKVAGEFVQDGSVSLIPLEFEYEVQ